MPLEDYVIAAVVKIRREHGSEYSAKHKAALMALIPDSPTPWGSTIYEEADRLFDRVYPEGKRK
jgi:hypothetical protein